MQRLFIRRTPPLLAILLLLVFGPACQKEAGTADAEGTPETDGGGTIAETPDAEGWMVLFDGTSTEHWRGYRSDSLPEAWVVTDDGALYLSSEGEGGDIVTTEQYANFELELEWKISEGGNSGIMFRVSEEHDAPWRTGPEMQVLDDERHPDAAEGEDRLAGANYDMHGPSEKVVNPAGEWNQVRLVVDGAHVEHWLNGTKIVDYELGSDDWKQRIAESKWIEMPDYGKMPSGHICLQDHSDPVWYRNIRIRRL